MGSGIHSVESGIQHSLGLPYMGRLNCCCCCIGVVLIYIYITRAPVFVFVCLFYVTEICGKMFYIINEVKILC